MTRDQLIEKRRLKKRKKQIIAGGCAAGAFIVVLILVRGMMNRPFSTKQKIEKHVELPVTAELDTDTATRSAVSSGVSGSPGWNTNASGWYYLNDDGTIFTNGWKTIDGQRYYFKPSGYMATGWVNTGEVKDRYFDECGNYDDTKYQKLVALTYDDGPSESGTPKVLDALEKYGQKATFFVVGQQAEYYSDFLRREVELGMEVGNHTWDHPWLNQLSEEEIQAEIKRNDDLVENLSGYNIEIMRPTGGGISANLINAVDKPMIQWDLDTLDWEHKDAEKTYQNIINQVKDGSIVLMHDLFSPAGDSADRTISTLLDMGYKCVTVSELAEAYGYEMEPGGQYYAFYPGGSERNKSKAEGLENPVAAWDQ